jgi:DNA invertase Pin-like site-specific DNA recombinase
VKDSTSTRHGPSSTGKRCALYVRVSTPKKTDADASGERKFEQNPDVQRGPLEELAKARGWAVTRCYVDRVTGAKENRPGLDELMADARRGKFQVVLVWRFDRFARTVKQLVNSLDEFRSLGIDFVSTKEAMDTSTPMGKAMFAIVAAMAELSRDITRENILSGMAYAAKHGTKSGKPPGRPRRVFDRKQALDMLKSGDGWKKIADRLGVSVSTLWRHVQKGRLNQLVQTAQTMVQTGRLR